MGDPGVEVVVKTRRIPDRADVLMEAVVGRLCRGGDHKLPDGDMCNYSPTYTDDLGWEFRHIAVSVKLWRRLMQLAQHKGGIEKITLLDLKQKFYLQMSDNWSFYGTHQRSKMLLFKRKAGN